METERYLGIDVGTSSLKAMVLDVGGGIVARGAAGYRTLHPAAGTPGARMPQDDRQRIEQLYNRSWELYSQGELEAARRGFVEVAQSGLYAAPEGKRPEDYVATIDRLLASAPSVAPAVSQGVAPANPSPGGEQGGFIAVIALLQVRRRKHR